MDLSLVKNRQKLKWKREPYWQRLRIGCFLGYRPSKNGRGGTWIARAYDEDVNRYKSKSLGDLGSLDGKSKFTAAKDLAEKFAELVESGGEVRRKIVTVADACRDYALSRPEADQRFHRYVYDDPIARIKIEKLRRRHTLSWRAKLEKTPALISRSKKGEAESRPRAPSTINRDMSALRAALFQVLSPGQPNSNAAWQEGLKAIPNADRQRTLYIDKDQRRQLLECIDVAARPFVHALCLMPLRPGAMASLSVEDFDKRTEELTIGQDKNGKPRRIRVPEAMAGLIVDQSSGKLPGDPLFENASGLRWNRHSWKRPISKAVKKSGLPHETTAYTLRHSTITDLVIAGLPLLSIAQISDTSAEMIERHYGHLVGNAAVSALQTLAL